MRSILAFVICLALPLPLLANGANVAELPNGQQYISNQILVVNEYNAPAYLTGQSLAGFAVTGVTSVDELCRNLGVIKIEPFYPGRLHKPALIREISRMYIFTLAEGEFPELAMADFEADPNIEFAELRYLPALHYVPNDPRASDQWYLAHTQAYQAWDIVRGDTTRHSIIGIVDSGVQWGHPDLFANIWVNPGEDINHDGIFEMSDLNGIDDDNNGFVDDIVGYDFGDNDWNPADSEPHGTPVAGCAAEVADNALMGAGFGFYARIMCLKGFSAQGADHLWDGVVYAADMGAQIINCSWGTLTFSQAEQNVVNAAWESGSLIIASAGGQGNTTPNYPAAYNHVMAVAATTQDDYRASFSGYGSWVDISAPGLNISTTIGESGFTDTYSGTSFSTAMVSGLAALVCAWHPDYSNDQIEEAIELGADSIPYNNGTMGAGRINCFRAITVDPQATNEDPSTPDKFALHPNYPNPFNAQTAISYNLLRPSNVRLEIYDLLGRKVGSLLSEYQEAGEHSVIWDAGNLTSGIYLYRLNAGNYTDSRRCLLLK